MISFLKILLLSFITLNSADAIAISTTRLLNRESFSIVVQLHRSVTVRIYRTVLNPSSHIRNFTYVGRDISPTNRLYAYCNHNKCFPNESNGKIPEITQKCLRYKFVWRTNVR